MKHVLSISHTDLDGFTCSHLVERFYSDREEKVTYINVDYKDLSEKLESEIATLEYDEIIITDLNLKEKDIEILEDLYNAYDKITLIDHHNNDMNRLYRMEKTLNELGVEVELIVEKGESAAKLTLAYLVGQQETSTFVSSIDLVTYVNAWDVHDFTVEAEFKLGQLLNDKFTDISRIIKPALSTERYSWMMRKCIQSIPIIVHSRSGAGDICYVENSINGKLPYHLISIIFKEMDIDNNIRMTGADMLFNLGFTQAISLLTALVSSEDNNVDHEFTDSYVIDDLNISRVLIPEQPLPMSVVHHILYTLKSYDVVCNINRHRGSIEFRQSSNNSIFNLSEIAKQLGGGGHRNASGCPIPDVGEDSIIRYMLFKRFNEALI